jgi:large subunit ribosomal protein L35
LSIADWRLPNDRRQSVITRVKRCDSSETNRQWTIGNRKSTKVLAEWKRPATFPAPMPRSVARRKTKKSAAKRFKVTASGKLLRRKPGLRHLASSKSSKRKRKLGKAGQVHETMVDRIKECLPFV